MALINPTIPTIGQPNSTEDQDIVNALTTIIAAINGGLDTANIAAAAGLTAAQLTTAIQAAAGLNGSGTRRGKCIVDTAETRTNAAYGTLTTPDQVSNIVLPTDGLLFIAYRARWSETVLGAARAAIFLGSNQLKTPPLSNIAVDTAPIVQEASVLGATVNKIRPLTTSPQGLTAQASGGNGHYTGDVTTGMSLGFEQTGGDQVGGPCVVFAAAGTYNVSVQFKASSGDVTARDRRLLVWSMGFD
jgi:hypothetical protein